MNNVSNIEMTIELNQIEAYVLSVICNKAVDHEGTDILLYTKFHGILSPKIIKEQIALGNITVINNSQSQAA